MAHIDRNREICKLYSAGWTIAALATQYAISRQRVRQLVKAGGVWKRAAARPTFLGVDVTPETKEQLKLEADRQQTSMSKLASHAITTMLERTQK